MSDEADATVRQHEHLSAAIQGIVGLDPEITEGSFLVGYALVAEFADPDGTRWFCCRQGDASGPRLYPWTEEGYLRHGLRALQRRELDRYLDEDDGGED